MELRDLTTEMQTWCHCGESDSEVYVKIHDTYYKVKNLQRVHFDTVDKTYFVIEASNE